MSDAKLHQFLADCYDDPLAFVLDAYPWGEPGALRDFKGPDAWQRQILEDIGAQVKARGFDGRNAVPPLRFATASGHGIGKTVLVSWLVNWLMATRPHCQGTITANTFQQLQAKTWASIQRWSKLCITAPWFTVTNDRMYHVESKESWFCSAQTCREENSEAFAGQHAATSTSFYIFDEASAIPDKIWEVAEGGLTDGEPHIYAFGNPTQRTGKFYRICFGSERQRWQTRSIDSRQSALTNKTQIDEWITDYGEDSDFVRVRVRGLPPAASDLQFIDANRIFEAQKREAMYLPDDPLVIGLDIARGGGDNNVFWFRRGLDARSLPCLVVPGEESRDSMRIVSMAVEVLNGERSKGLKPSMMFIDGSGVGGPIPDRLKQLGYDNIQEVQFGWKAPDAHYLNMRSYMWGRMRDWLTRGAIPSDARLEMDLTAPQYGHNSRDQLFLEAKEDMKKRGLDSPDYADALALTFAYPVGPARKPEPTEPLAVYEQWEGTSWMA